MKGQHSKPVKGLLLLLGTLYLVIGIVGIFIPLLPTTPFLLMSALCYLRSSKGMYDWLMTNRFFGKFLTDYMNGRGVPLRVKIITILVLWVTLSASAFLFVEKLWMRILLAAIATGVTIHLLMLKTRKG